MELAEAILTRIEDHERLGAFITVTPERARADAREADERRARGASRGPLDGLPIAIKDNIDVAGIRCTGGSAWFRDRVPRRDAFVVRRLRAAGAVIVGKTNMYELAYGATGDNPHYGDCHNAWDLARVPGGSSGGSAAALGADLCFAALGTDTGGSVRQPAALNGVTALRPTYGSVSNRGVLAVSPSLDTVGSMARSARDAAALASAVSAYDPKDPCAVAPPGSPPPDPPAGPRPLSGLRVGVARGYFFEGVAPAVAANAHAAADTLARLGAELSELDTPDAKRATDDTRLLIHAEALATHERRFNRDAASLGDDVRRRLELGRRVTGVQVAHALDRMRQWRVRMHSVLERVDLILTPTTVAVAPLLAGADMIATTARLTLLTYPWSLASLPAISLPSGLDEAGLPTGVQLAAAPWRDELLLRVGVAFQEVTGFHRLRPAS